jgi:2-oxoglutarate ferredoxin oxidoreductase subunit beta
VTTLTRKDLMTDQTIRWCPGCGDYSILAQMQTALAGLGVPRENLAIISGIGCSSRLPYYMETYGFHTIHGRAPAIATGLKVARPELSVWVATGDGDGLSIGGNHLAHLFRRNVDLNVVLFNNQIYGLTKGQYSPTSREGQVTKSSPMGVVDRPFLPLAFALGAGATHVARSVDVFPKHLRDQIVGAHLHPGTSFLEVLQNCNIFNDGAFDPWTDKVAREERVLYAEPGKPLQWGKSAVWGLVRRGLGVQAVQVTAENQADILVHDPTDPGLAWALATLDGPDAPLVVGTLYAVERPRYEDGVRSQLQKAQKGLDPANIEALLATPDAVVVR